MKHFLSLRCIPLLFLLVVMAFVTGCASIDDYKTQEVNAALELGGMFLTEGDIDKALETYDRGLLVQPDDTRLLYNKIAALIKASRFGEAAEVSRISYERHPHLLRFAKAQAASLELAGQAAEAIPIWREIIDLDPADSESRIRLMNLLIDAQAYDVARDHALFLLDRKSNDKAALEALVQIDGATRGTSEPWSTLLEAGFPVPVK